VTGSREQDVLTVDRKALVVREQCQGLEQGLCHETSIEWISKVMRKSSDLGSMLQSEGQRQEPTIKCSHSNLIDICRELAELGLDRNLPQTHWTDVDLIESIRDQDVGARRQEGIILEPPQEDVRVEQ
jgi:hypothetical protein